MKDRIYLSPPQLDGREFEFISEALDSGWIAPLGPAVDAFEREIADKVGVGHGAALISGTAALHLALRLVGVGPGDEVLCSSFTFCASATPIVYLGARPVFIDAEAESWCIDPVLVEETLDSRAKAGSLPTAVVVADIYGQCADYRRLEAICDQYEVPLIEDAAESLGGSCYERPAGSFGRCAIFSFNGNKIITTSGGGMLVTNDEGIANQARFLAAQARDPGPHYQHSTIGYNYRLSNILAAIGRAQLLTLEQRVSARRRIFERYVLALQDLPGITFMPEAPWGRATRWLSCMVIDPAEFGAATEDVRRALEKQNIEARRVWKPLHRQPVFEGCESVGGRVAEELFERGLCLPSGSNLSDPQLERIAGVIRGVHPFLAR